VYATIVLALAALGVAWWGGSRATQARGQIDVTIDPAMVKGAAGAVVTIFEFSDYQ
jgi:hypothetical protein